MLCQSAFGPLNPSYTGLTTRQVNPVFQSKEGVTLIQWFCFTFLEQILLLWKFVFDSLGRQAGPTASTPTCPYQFLWISCPLASPLASRTSLGPLWTQFYTVWRGYLTTIFVLKSGTRQVRIISLTYQENYFQVQIFWAPPCTADTCD